MESGSKQGKSTGYSPSGPGQNVSASAHQESTESEKGSQALSNVHLKDESSSFAAVVYPSQNLPAILLALQVMMADFREVKNQIPTARVASSNGKIYFSVEIPGKILAVENGKILVDGTPVDSVLTKLLAQK